MKGTCVACSGSGDYYKFSGDTCEFVGKTECTKIIYNSFQCVDSCSDSYSYSLGSICYQGCDENMINSESNKCKCIDKYFRTNEGPIEQYHCLRENVLCNPEHKSYDPITKECFKETCGNEKIMKIENRSGSSSIAQCLDSCNEFYYEENGKKYCISSCPKDKSLYYIENNVKNCVNSCNVGDYLYQLGNDQCVKYNDCTYINGSKCTDSCLHNDGDKACVQFCQGSYPYKNGQLCVQTCPTGFINQNNECVNSPDDKNCFYTIESENSNNKICYSSCKESPNPLQIYDSTKSSISHKCVKECTEPYPYLFENEQTCYDKCESIPILKNIKNSNYHSDTFNKICYCHLFGITDNGEYKCYNDEEGCINDQFKYKKDNQCVKECTSFIYEVPNNSNGKKLNECYNTVEDCKYKDYYYYNTKERRCYISLPDDANSNEINTESRKPKEDEGRNTYTRGCESLLFPKKTTKGICKKECDKDEYFRP